MRFLDPIQKNPVAALAVVLAGITGWVAAGLFAPGDPLPPPQQSAKELPAPGLQFLSDEDMAKSRESRPLSVAVLPRLKAGMTRSQVEGVVGPPSDDSLHPVSLIGGRMTYCTAYDLAEPDLSTVRPIAPRSRVLPRPPAPLTPPKSLVALEYDASKPGHPLIEVYFLDPLF